MTEVYCNSCGAIDRPMFDGEDDYCANCGRGNVEPVEDNEMTKGEIDD